LEAWLCIGDGYIFVFREAVDGSFFAAWLATVIEVMVAKKTLPVDFHFRIGVHAGPVYTFWDPGRKNWNYIGDGINGGNRVLNAAGKDYDDVMYVSGEVREKITAANQRDFPYAPLLDNMHNRGRKPDKHGNLWRVYEVSHTAVCRQWLPPELL
jgi:class 3 adenylate cyclase